MGILAAVKAAVLIIVGAAFGWIVSSAYASLISVPAAREAGRLQSELAHEAERRVAEAEAAKARDAAQASIDLIEADYLRRDAQRAARISSLEHALQEADVAPNPSLVGGACRVLVPDSVSRAVDAVGRAAARPHSAKPDRAMPAGR